MVKILSTIVLILSIILFPPAALALVSNNAVPGDATYPVKRVLEDGIYAVASLNPTTKSWFAKARSDRRFKEFTTLITQGKKASDTLNELVSQTDIAASEIQKINDPARKQELIDQLLDSIQKYDQGLEQASKQVAPQQIAQIPQSTPQPDPVAAPAQPQQQEAPITPPAPTTQPKAGATPKSPTALKPTPKPQPTKAPTPRPTQQATPLPQTPAPSPVQTVPTQGGNNSQEIDEARKKIDDIKKKAEEEKEKLKKEQEEKKEIKKLQQMQDNERKEQREVKKNREKDSVNNNPSEAEERGERTEN